MADRLVRYKRTSDTGTTRTITFDEPTPLDSSHVLVLIATVGSATAFTNPAGWTAIGGSGANGTNQVRSWFRVADGVINSVTLVSPSGTVEAELFGVKGYMTATPLVANGANIASGTVGGNAAVPASWSPAQQYGIGFMVAATATAPTGWGSWSGMTSNGGLAAGQRLQTAREEILPGSGFGGTVSWTGARTGRQMWFGIALQPDDGPDGLLVSDDFDRTLTATEGWGVPDFGPKWTIAGPSAGTKEASVEPGHGILTTASGSGTQNIYPETSQTVDLYLSLGIGWNALPVGGTSRSRLGMSSLTAGVGDWHLRMLLNPDGSVGAQMARGDAAFIGSQYMIPSYTYAPGDIVRVKFWVTGTSPTRLRFKIWVEGTDEPADWAVDTTDGTAAMQGVFKRIYLHGHRPAAITAPNPLETYFSNIRIYNQEPTEAPPEGGFAGAYAFGPASARGESPRKGGFAAGGYGWGAATAGGSRDSTGLFAGAYAFGPASTVGSSDRQGTFAAAYAFGPALAGGTTDPLGSFATGLAFGPATASGLTDVEGDFATAYSFGPAVAGASSDRAGGFGTSLLFGPAAFDGSSDRQGAFGAAYSFGPAGFTANGGASGGFVTGFVFGPAEAGGSADPAGDFAATYGFGPATATGSASARGGFEALLAWGPAVAGGSTDEQGNFETAYLFGPALAGGTATPVGQFETAYHFGPAVFGASGDEFCWPDHVILIPFAPRVSLLVASDALALIPTGPHVSLSHEAPSTTLSAKAPRVTLEVIESC